MGPIFTFHSSAIAADAIAAIALHLYLHCFVFEPYPLQL